MNDNNDDSRFTLETTPPNLDGVPQDVIDHIFSQAEVIERLNAELSTSPTNEARGVAWTDVYGMMEDEQTGELKQVRIAITARSNVSARDAYEQLKEALRAAANDNLYPYTPSYPLPTGSKQPVQYSEPAYDPEKYTPSEDFD